MILKEIERLKAVNRFLNLEITKAKELQEVVDLAAEISGTPIALITFIDKDTQYIKFKKNFPFDTTSRQDAFCNHVINNEGFMIVPDAMLDERFAQNPLVINNPNIRFYAGTPLTTIDGHNLGSLCVIDYIPNQLDKQQQKTLKMLAKQVTQLLDFDISVNILKDQCFEAQRTAIELKSFFECSIDSHLLLGKNFEILAFNKASERHYKTNIGLSFLKGKSIYDFLRLDLVNEFEYNCRKALKGTAVFKEIQLNNDDKSAWWMMKYEPAFNESGEIIGVCVNSTDITTRVGHENNVISKNNRLRKIAIIQSHELRRPVASILGLMNILKMDGNTEKIQELKMMEIAVNELDEKIRMIVGLTD